MVGLFLIIIISCWGLWKSILFVKAEFRQWIGYRVHDGKGIKFWHDEWCGQSTLKNQFPAVFLLDKNPQAFIADFYQFVSGSLVWNFQFHRNLWIIK